MDADEFRDYILGFIFYKYLSEKIHLYANSVLKQDGITYDQVDEKTAEGQEIIEVITEEALDTLGYFLKPSELFSAIAKKGASTGSATLDEEERADNFILDELTQILNHIEQSTMGTASFMAKN